jgi:molybdenum cofactor synthesis domain-containing protein
MNPVAGLLERLPGGPVRAAILTVSDRASRHEYPDRSGPPLAERIESAGGLVVAREIVSDDIEVIAAALCALCDAGSVDLVLTTGGTGFAPRDVTPEATRRVLDREAPGLAEVMRQATRPGTPTAPLSRAICGLRGRAIVINLPGSPRGALGCLEAILDLLPHAVTLVRGGNPHADPRAGA